MKRFRKLLITVTIALPLVQCAKETIYVPDLSETSPKILSTWPAPLDNGLPGSFNVRLGDTLRQEVIYTPTKFATCVWYLDGEKVAQGPAFTYIPKATGQHYIKIIVATARQSTYRTAYLNVIQ